MSIANYIEQAINELLKTDNEIKAQFYSQPDASVSEEWHKQHHQIKKLISQLQEIKVEGLTIEKNVTIVHPKLPTYTYFVIARSDMSGKAYGVLDGSRFKVLSGSFIASTMSLDMYEIVKRLRAQNSVFINSDNILTKEISFDNPGQAARFVTGIHVNGIEEWKTPDGISLKQYSKHNTAELVDPVDFSFKNQ